MQEATCCEDKEHCCPHDLPVCDTDEGRCLPKPVSAWPGKAGWVWGEEAVCVGVQSTASKRDVWIATTAAAVIPATYNAWLQTELFWQRQ